MVGRLIGGELAVVFDEPGGGAAFPASIGDEDGDCGDDDCAEAEDDAGGPVRDEENEDETDDAEDHGHEVAAAPPLNVFVECAPYRGDRYDLRCAFSHSPRLRHLVEQPIFAVYSVAMKLVLMRHARANDGLPDKARRLSDEGREQAKDRGRQLADTVFDSAYVSDSARTKETFRLLQVDADRIEEMPELYLGSHETVIELVRNLSEDEKMVLIVGHEPTISAASALLGSTSARVHEVRTGVSPSTAIVLEFDSWDGPGTIIDVMRPQS